MKPIEIFVDGATGGQGARASGVAAVACTSKGHYLGWMSRQMQPMTSNEAEYHAAQLGLTLAQALGLTRFTIVSDSATVVRQMQGRSRVLSQRLQGLHRETCHRVGFFEQVQFRHVLRERNRLADALAVNALGGQIVRMPDGDAARNRERRSGRFEWMLQHLGSRR